MNLALQLMFSHNLNPFGRTADLPAVFFSGAKRDRTADLLNAIQALSQLSYSPNKFILLILGVKLANN